MDQCKADTTVVLDRAGMSASIVCAVHCALLPLVLMILPALGLAWLDSAWVDWTMVAVAAGIAFTAHRGGYATHSRCLPAGVALLGILVIITTICVLKGSASQHYIQASGALMITGSHFLNRCMCRKCVSCGN